MASFYEIRSAENTVLNERWLCEPRLHKNCRTR